MPENVLHVVEVRIENMDISGFNICRTLRLEVENHEGWLMEVEDAE